MVQTADVVVVGGGVNGTSIAYALASKGVRCVLVEKGAVASGASGRSSALVRMHYTNEWDARLAWASFPVFRHWSELIGGPPVFTHTGFVNAVAPAYAEHLRQERRDAAGHRDQYAGDHGGRAEGAAALRQRGRRGRGGLRAGQRLRQPRRDGGGLPPAHRGAGRQGHAVDGGHEDRPPGQQGARRRDERRAHRRGRGRAGGGGVVAAHLPRARHRSARAAQGHRHGGGGAAGRPAVAHGLHRQRAGQLLPDGGGRAHAGRRAVPGVGHRSRHARQRAAAARRGAGRPARHPSHPGDGARDAGAWLPRVRRL